MKTLDYREGLMRRLRNRRYALGLLKTALEESCEDGNWDAFGLILQDVIEAQGSKREFAKKAGISRQQLYRLFGKSANPTLQTTLRVLGKLGYKLTIAAEKEKKAAA